MMRPVTLLLLLAGLAAAGCTGTAGPPPAVTVAADTAGIMADTAAGEPAADTRPAAWARPLVRPGLPNLHQVSDSLYRGAQPEAAGIPELRQLGVRTIINLRGFHSDRDEIDTAAIRYEHITFNTWHPEY
ncbi:MAG TPA: hypothetical protein PKM88_03085, partial [bacterium]|nr:hypothetical protein [bacterium]